MYLNGDDTTYLLTVDCYCCGSLLMTGVRRDVDGVRVGEELMTAGLNGSQYMNVTEVSTAPLLQTLLTGHLSLHWSVYSLLSDQSLLSPDQSSISFLCCL